MDEYLCNYFIALPVLVPIDFLWFGVLMKGLYLKELSSIARMKDGKFAPDLVAGLFAWAVIPLASCCSRCPTSRPAAPSSIR